MPRSYIWLGALHEVRVLAPGGDPPVSAVIRAQVGHGVHVEDTFFLNNDFLRIMKLQKVQDIRNANAGITIYRHRVTSNCIALGAMKRFSFVIQATNPENVSPRFGTSSKIIQPAAFEVTKEGLEADCNQVTFNLIYLGYFAFLCKSKV
jgi:hypothetical protein